MGDNLLFVYGTLRGAAKNPQAVRLARESEHVGEGFVRGRLLAVAHFPGLIEGQTEPRWSAATAPALWRRPAGMLVGAEGRGHPWQKLSPPRPLSALSGTKRNKAQGDPNIVRGDVLRLHDPDVTWRWLDAYEGADFRRGRCHVVMQEGGEKSAWCYRYIGPTRGLKCIRSGDFLKAP